ncbi:metabolism of cobalamin associated Db isoform X3 [Anabas testudineus]|uniref:metabolism of cobalamin associated Db isoform X3 n=1 Tax=Anabas testudineus TaxID=64144 RepID=UPI000E46066A|nr:metabolism of cobalamin associated Db isoform X3 [Anabas testudineus]
MARVLCSRPRLVTYLPGLHVLVNRVAGSQAIAFSAAGSLSADEAITTTDIRLRNENMGSFGPQDHHYQLPANLGFDCHLEGQTEQKKSLAHTMVLDKLSASFSSERCELILAQFTGVHTCEKADLGSSQRAEEYFDNANVECAIQSCPELLQKDFQSMFPEAPSSGMMVLTVTQKTQNDMTSWCADVEHEREQMLAKFIDGAKEICYALQKEGFWADFIDPSSGLAILTFSHEGPDKSMIRTKGGSFSDPIM